MYSPLEKSNLGSAIAKGRATFYKKIKLSQGCQLSCRQLANCPEINRQIYVYELVGVTHNVIATSWALMLDCGSSSTRGAVDQSLNISSAIAPMSTRQRDWGQPARFRPPRNGLGVNLEKHCNFSRTQHAFDVWQYCHRNLHR